ncbi:MAG: pyridoxal phosphate-dependent aminotransferase family protein [Bacteroidales bacterium]|nr:pyridoxal phosphate-dependent aminotransferase family protein [Bacteroidales bacterium]MDD4770162.1 pyridoxal phosphate-dependent aminotransferase family protein [Bacteroidales bacterium]
MDLFERIRQNEEPVSKLARQMHGYFTYPKLEGKPGPRMKFRGREVLNWNISDHFGFTSNPDILAFDEETTKKWGISYPVGNRIMSGHTTVHEQLESRLAEFTAKEDAIVLNYGYQSFFSILDALCNRSDVIVYDSLVHASLLDGIRLHLGKHFAFQHNNIESLEKQLTKAETAVLDSNGGILVVTHGVFSTTGEFGCLDKITALKSRYSFRLLVNDADGFAVEGKTGAGTGELLGVNDQIDLYLGSFSKALASIGSFVSGPEHIMNFLRYHMRTQIHSKALPIIYAAGVLKRLDYLAENPKLKVELHKKVLYFRKALREKGFDTGNSNAVAIPVFLSCTIYQALNLIIDLRENYNVFCPVLVYPFVMKDKLMLRFLPTILHSLEDIDYTVTAMCAVRQNLEDGKYNDKSDYMSDEEAI